MLRTVVPVGFGAPFVPIDPKRGQHGDDDDDGDRGHGMNPGSNQSRTGSRAPLSPS